MQLLRVAAILLLTTSFAFGLRAYRLDVQSLSHDEILTILASQDELAEIVRGESIADFPPLYFLMLRGWSWLAGESEFALRFLSVALATLAIPLLYQVGRKLINPLVGTVAALLGSFSPLLVYYSQEARPNALVALFSLLSVYLLLHALEKDKRHYWLAWALVSVAALLTDYKAFLVFAFEEVFLLGMLLKHRKPSWLNWLLAQGILLVCLLPWVIFRDPLSDVSGEATGMSPRPAVLSVLHGSFRALTVGESLEGWQAWAAIAILISIATLGLVVVRVQSRWKLFLLGYLILPICLAYVLLIYSGVGFAPRYVLMATPAFLMLVACGLVWFKARSAPLLGMAAIPVAVLSGISLFNYYYEPWYGHEDFRSAASYIDDNWREGDVVIFNARWNDIPFSYYGRRQIEYVGLPQSLPLNADQTIAKLEKLQSQYERIWLVLWQDWFADPGGFVKDWLNKNAFFIGRTGFSHITVYGYLAQSPILDSLPSIQHMQQADLEGKVRFLGYDLDISEAESRARIHVTLYWQALKPLDKSYRVYVHLINDAHCLYGQKDNRPAYDCLPTDHWQERSIVKDEYRIDLFPGTPPGEYQIAVGMYDPSTRQALQVSDQQRDYLLFGPIEIGRARVPPAIDTLDIQQKVRKDFGHIELLGYSLGNARREGRKLVLDAKPGQTVSLTLFWRAKVKPTADHWLSLRLVGDDGRSYGERYVQPVDGTYPTTRWEHDEIVRDIHDLIIAGDAPNGEHRLKLGVGVFPEFDLGEVRIERQVHPLTPPGIQYPVFAKLGDGIEFLGYDPPTEAVQPGDTLKLTLYWRASGPIDISYTVFTHLLDMESHVWGQEDDLPQDGTAPTTSWQVGEVIIDEYIIPVKSDAPPGEYWIEVGMYDARTHERLLVDEGEDRILLTRVTVQE